MGRLIQGTLEQLQLDAPVVQLPEQSVVLQQVEVIKKFP